MTQSSLPPGYRSARPPSSLASLSSSQAYPFSFHQLSCVTPLRRSLPQAQILPVARLAPRSTPTSSMPRSKWPRLAAVSVVYERCCALFVRPQEGEAVSLHAHRVCPSFRVTAGVISSATTVRVKHVARRFAQIVDRDHSFSFSDPRTAVYIYYFFPH